MKTRRVVTLGEALIDFVSQHSGCGLEQTSGFSKAAGGAPANVAVACAKLGGSAVFIGKTGDDAFGRFLRQALQESGVEVNGFTATAEAKTGLAFVSLTAEGERDFIFYRDQCADMLLEPEDVGDELLAGAMALHIGSISLIQEPSRSATYTAVHKTKSFGGIVSFDVNWRPPLWTSLEHGLNEIDPMIGFADIIKVNEEEMLLFTGKDRPEAAAAELHRKGVSFVLISLGEKGCYYSYASGGETLLQGSVPGIQVQVADTTGAGDSFIGGFLTRLTELSGSVGGPVRLGQWSWPLEAIEESLRFAIATSALTVTRIGSIPALPTREQVEQLLSTVRR